MTEQKSFYQMLEEKIQEPDPNPFLFQEGQKVRVNKDVTKDGQTPAYWAGALVTVTRRTRSWLYKEHWYTLRHPNGQEDEFRETELDYRYKRKD